jgi:outer membrane protein insertion porin family
VKQSAPGSYGAALMSARSDELMKSPSFFVVVLLLLTASASVTLAQTNDAASIGELPCIEDSLTGRPTLKRRQPAPQTPTIDESSVDQKLLLKEKCKQKDPTSDALGNQPIRIEFDGLHAFTEVDMLKAFRERGIGLPTSQMPDSQVLAKGNALIKELLESRGYFNATVAAHENEDEGSIGFVVYEGQRFPLAEVRFKGNQSFSSVELASKIGECQADDQLSQSGYDSEIFDFCARGLLNFIQSRGHLQATFGEAIKEIDGRGLVLTIPVNEGLLYRLGEIKIEGSKAVAAEQIRAMLNLKRGEIANGEKIGKWLFENLKKTYGEMGYIQYTAEPEPEFRAADDRNEGIVDFTVSIDEGRQFRIHNIKFKGDSVPEKELLSVLRIGAGDVFNQRLFEESIEELNELGWFRWIDKDRDVDFATDEEEGIINMVIKVNNLN